MKKFLASLLIGLLLPAMAAAQVVNFTPYIYNAEGNPVQPDFGVVYDPTLATATAPITVRPYYRGTPKDPKAFVLINPDGTAYSPGGGATLNANSVLGNPTASSAAGISVALPSCSTASSALRWTTSTGFTCLGTVGNTATTNTWALAQTFTVAPVFTDASGSRTALGLGNMATQAASAVNITGGTIVGITDLAVADGGTGSSTAANARLALNEGMNQVNTATFTASAGPTAALPSGFQSFHVVVAGVIPSSAGAMTLRLSFDGGATYKSGASDYSTMGVYVITGSGTVTGFGSLTQAAIGLTFNTVATTASINNVFEFDIIMPRTSAFGTAVKFRSDYGNATPQYEVDQGAGRIIPGYGIPTNFQFIPGAGTITGTITVYGNP